MVPLTADPLTLDTDAPRYAPQDQQDLGARTTATFGGSTSAAVRLSRNLDALRALQQVASGEPLTSDLQSQIAGWSGWGALPRIFDERDETYAEQREQLRALLAPELYTAAERTVLNAHYTDADIATRMWSTLEDLGLTDGEVLEPGSGSGNFIGLTPPSLRDRVRVTGVELDPLSANIARALYPDAVVRTESFVDTPHPGGTFDAAIGNVPFAQVRLYDPKHNPDNFPIHDHFIAKTVDLVRPGGTVAVLTSRYTLDKADERARRAIYEQADLIGAVRLPAGAHRRAAGTDVVTDLLLLRRREEGRERGDDTWLTTAEFAEGVRTNDYFRAHPERVLGSMSVGHGLHGAELVVMNEDMNVLPDLLDTRLRQVVHEARDNGLVHSERQGDSPRITPEMSVARAGDPTTFAGYIQQDGDTFTQVLDGAPQPMDVPKAQRAELGSLLALRDTTLALLDAEAATSDDTPQVNALRAQLNAQYDAYVDRYGPINRVQHRRTGRVDENGDDILARVRPRVLVRFGRDPFAPPVWALEKYDEATGEATKAALMRQRVLERRVPVTSVDNAPDALAVCLDQHGEIDLPTIAALLDVEPEQARSELGQLVFDDPTTGELVTAAEYLSGDVRAKLDAAREAAADDEAYEVNVAALEPIIPEDLGPGEIHASLGAVWIPAEDVEAFLRETLADESVEVRHGAGAMWSVTGNRRSVAATSTWGTDRLDALTLASRLLQQQETVIRDEVETPEGGTTRVVNPEATDAATEKATAMRERFAEWVWQDPQRADRLAETYNRMFNATVLRSYDGQHRTLPGLATWFTPHPHQRAAVDRIVSEPSVGLFHQVGAGKTAEMVMGTQELRRLGMANKPAIVVPNHMLEQFTREYLALYPRANVLAAGSEDLTKDNRRLFMAKVATGDWDAVIMTRGAFHSVPVSAETEADYLARDQDTLRASLTRMSDDPTNARMVKRIQTQLAQNEQANKRKLDRPRDEGLTFEQLGIDYLMVDELHDYKNLRIVSSIRDAAHEGSKRATDLDMRLDYLRRTHGDRVFTGATATPIANSIAEAYVMQRYIRPDLLDKAEMPDFDSWAATFGETVTAVELAPEGGGNYRTTTRFARFRNVPELLTMWHVAADVKTAEDLTYLSRPQLRARKDGQRLPETVVITPSDEMSAYVVDLGDRAEKVRARLVEPTEDNMLKISGEGRAAALDLRLVGQEPPEDELFHVPTKLETAAQRIHSIWQTHRHDRYPTPDDPDGTEHPSAGSLQIVFCDLGTPTGSARFNAYEELRDQLAQRGMDPRRVRFIHDAANDAKKAVLFEQCRTGQVDVIVGSTAKMGVGTNIQARAVALHHLDCPWRPADIEQREGRILRQGNLNPEVGMYRYVVEGSFDAYSWQTVERKAKFIDQIMRGSLDQREIEDIGDSTLSFNEVKAIASGDPLILERAEVEQNVATLTRLERSHSRTQTGLRGRIQTAERDLQQIRDGIPRIEAAIAATVDTRGEAFAATVDGMATRERPEAAAALRGVLDRHLSGLDKHTRIEATPTDVLRLGGHTFDARVRLSAFGGEDAVELRLSDLPQVRIPVDLTETGHGIITKAENAVAGLPKALDRAHAEERRAVQEVDEARSSLGAPFPRAGELREATQRLAEIDAKMSAKSGVPPRAGGHDDPRAGDDGPMPTPEQAVAAAEDAGRRPHQPSTHGRERDRHDITRSDPHRRGPSVGRG